MPEDHQGDRQLVPNPDLASFGRFIEAMHGSFPEKNYRWTRAKERSCDWIAERIPAGTTGVDVGGTEYLCTKLAEKGCTVTFYDFVAPRDFPRSIQDDMFNIMRHFEPRSLDFITTRHTLEHSFVPLFQLWAYNQLLKDDGILVVTVPSYHERWVWMTTHFHAVPPDTWHMLFHRAGFKVRTHRTGTWKRGHDEFVEHRFVLQVASRDLRLVGRPKKMLQTDPESMPGGRAVTAEQTASGEAVPGKTVWVASQPRPDSQPDAGHDATSWDRVVSSLGAARTTARRHAGALLRRARAAGARGR